MMNKQQKKWIIISFIGGFTVLLTTLSWNFFVRQEYPIGIIDSFISSITFTLAIFIFAFFKHRKNSQNVNNDLKKLDEKEEITGCR